MARKNREILHSFNGGFYTEQDFYTISLLFENLKLKCAQSLCSELIDLHNYKIRRDENKIKRELRSVKKSPFVFVSCLN
ncbi:MAG: hypothetical protein IT257_06880 [Chitinophagaceae bacterium]|nr:hypothetical protein [Chitinophagaceae bacterium]